MLMMTRNTTSYEPIIKGTNEAGIKNSAKCVFLSAHREEIARIRSCAKINLILLHSINHTISGGDGDQTDDTQWETFYMDVEIYIIYVSNYELN